MSFPEDISRALIQLAPIAPRDNPITSSVRALTTIALNDSVLQSLVLNPKVMGLVIMHCCLAELPGFVPKEYTSPLFSMDQVINPNGNDFWLGWQELITSHLRHYVCTLGADQGFDPAAIKHIALHIPDNLRGVVLQTTAPQHLELRLGCCTSFW